MKNKVQDHLYDFFINTSSYYILIDGRFSLNYQPVNYFPLQYQPINYLFDIFQYILLPIYSFIRLIVSSFDVIHTIGFYSLGIKIDAIPGKINSTTTLRLLIKGEYRGKCFELCGQGHLLMMSSTIVYCNHPIINILYAFIYLFNAIIYYSIIILASFFNVFDAFI